MNTKVFYKMTNQQNTQNKNAAEATASAAKKTKTAVIYPGKCSGEIKIPPSKSMAHRAIICASLASGTSHIGNIAFSEDIKATIACMKQLGAEITADGDTLTINGIGSLAALQRNVINHTVIDCNGGSIVTCIKAEIHYFSPLITAPKTPLIKE